MVQIKASKHLLKSSNLAYFVILLNASNLKKYILPRNMKVKDCSVKGSCQWREPIKAKLTRSLRSTVTLKFRKSISGHNFQTLGNLASNDFDYHTYRVVKSGLYGLCKNRLFQIFCQICPVFRKLEITWKISYSQPVNDTNYVNTM